MSRSPSTIGEFLRPAAHAWWLWALFAAACLVVGVIALIAPDFDLATYATLFGVYLLIAGVVDAAQGLTTEGGDPALRAVAVVLVAVAMVAGLIALRHPDEDLFLLVLTAGIYLIVAGALHLASGFDAGRGRVEQLLGGVDVIVGSLIMALPALRLQTFAPLFGIAILARGAAAVSEAVRLRSARSLERSPKRRRLAEDL
jgi:uncharacterized membrane protein HdeD (DUF308 family)